MTTCSLQFMIDVTDYYEHQVRLKNKNTIRKKGIPKIKTNKSTPSSKLSFGCSPHKDNCDILSEALVLHRL